MDIIKVTTQAQLDACFALRIKIFCDEQGVLVDDEFDDFDTLDALCDHLLMMDNGVPVASGRFRIVDGIGKLERIVVEKAHRAIGLGTKILSALQSLAVNKQLDQIKLHAQVQAKDFYLKQGFIVASDVFVEDGIDHVVMTKVVSAL